MTIPGSFTGRPCACKYLLASHDLLVRSFIPSGKLAAQPSNDQCANAVEVTSVPFSAIGNTVDATSDFGSATCNVAPADVGIWYQLNGDNKILRVSVTDSTFNSRLVAFQGTSCESLTCLFDNNGSGTNSFLSWAALSSETYHILVSGVSASSGTYNIAINVSKGVFLGLSCLRNNICDDMSTKYSSLFCQTYRTWIALQTTAAKLPLSFQ